MTASINRAEFDTLIAQTGLPLNDAQKAELHAAYPLLQALVATVIAPMPREAEPAVIFLPEVK